MGTPQRAAATTATRARRGTYSIVARDPATGELGVAVQSHYFSVGPIVPWARAGVGAVATQANVQVSYGPEALDLLAAGATAAEALAELVAKDDDSDERQVAVIDATGQVATHTGERCIAYAGDAVGEQVSCQANLMANRSVWSAMLAAFEQTSGSLAERMIGALDAAEASGGDVRGRQSAAILVVPAGGEAWETTVSLRVEDHPEPLHELRRLFELNRAYSIAGQGDDLVDEGRHAEAARLFEQACELSPDNHELLFWSGLARAQSDDVDAGVALVRRAIELQPGWAELLPRLPPDSSPSAATVAKLLGYG
jgi:uncharacterized Ntn-hydrolase superfamily protein